MKAFRRIFKYIWPQWYRVIAVVLSALVVASLLSVSFLTVIPLLKVMMGKEGLHGWVDRKACEWRYGLHFYAPETLEVIGDTGDGLGYSLLVTEVEDNSLAEAAGLRAADRIVGAGRLLIEDKRERIMYTRLLEELATTDANAVTVQVRRLEAEAERPETLVVTLRTPADRTAFGELAMGGFERLRRTAKLAILARAQWAVSLLPREPTARNKTRAVGFIILLMVGVTILRCAAKFYQGYLARKVVLVGINQLREDVFAHVLDMPMSYFAHERPSDTVSRIIRDTSVMGQAIKVMLGKALREPLNALFMLCFAMLLNWQLTVIFLCGAPLTIGLVGLFGRRIKRATRKSLRASSEMLTTLQEATKGLKVVKVYNQQQHEQKVFKVINRRLLKQLLKISKIEAATSPVLEVLGMVAGSAALVIGAQWVTRGKMDSPEFFTLLLLMGAAAEALRKSSDVWTKIQQANAAAERVFAVIDEPLEEEKPNAIELKGIREKIEFRDVTFQYPGSDRPALKGINLVVEVGHNVAIVGPNGSGKTTLVNLIPRFYDPSSGGVLIDGVDIRDLRLRSLREQIAMVTQDVVTFNDTIAANIGFGRPGASREEIIEAAKRAFAHEFIEPLPNGYDTVLGEHGAGLSGGQLQRIVIARAILKDPAILIFDEATSQIDAESEAKIHQAIEEIMHDRTSFIIAHRLSTVVSADMIVVIDDGQIVAQGRHEELIESCRLYQNLYETQLVKA